MIRPYQLDDLEDTVDLWYRTWHETFSHIKHPQPYSLWKARFRDDLAARGNVWLAEVEQLLPWQTVVQNVVYALETTGKAAWKAAIAEAVRYLDLVGVSAAVNKYPHQLSGGMKQRVA